jgi:hypothetical protein
MAFESIKAEISLLLSQMEDVPEDRHEIAFQIHEKLAELRAMGMPVPEDLARLEKELEEEFGRPAKD